MYAGLLKRTSVRSYLPKKIEPQKIEKIKQIINLSPTSMNAQEFSVIFVENKLVKEKISKLNWNQKHIIEAPLLLIFCADFNRINIACKNKNTPCKIEPIEKLTLATVDATIAAGMVAATADELDLSTCFIGGIRNYADQLTSDLDLQGQCTPIIAMTIGYGDRIQPLRPKINKVYSEKYNFNQITKEIPEYDQIMEKYYLSIFKQKTNWTKSTVDSMCGNKMDTSQRIKILKDQFKYI